MSSGIRERFRQIMRRIARMGQIKEEPMFSDLRMDPWSSGADIFLLKDMINELVKRLREKG